MSTTPLSDAISVLVSDSKSGSLASFVETFRRPTVGVVALTLPSNRLPGENHQGDVGEGSFAAVPHLVRIHRQRAVADFNTYALVATIELARGTKQNPDLPDWTRGAYDGALTELARIGLAELPRCSDQEAVRAILALLALAHGARTYGRLLLEFSEDEVLELEKQAFGDPGDDAG